MSILLIIPPCPVGKRKIVALADALIDACQIAGAIFAGQIPALPGLRAFIPRGLFHLTLDVLDHRLVLFERRQSLGCKCL